MSIELGVNNDSIDLMYSVRVDNESWSKEPISIKCFESRGFTVVESRSGKSDKDVFINHSLVARLFVNRTDALGFIEN